MSKIECKVSPIEQVRFRGKINGGGEVEFEFRQIGRMYAGEKSMYVMIPGDVVPVLINSIKVVLPEEAGPGNELMEVLS